uniref:Uncharacterized protein n=1 Tax=Zea mays TaxID=4577 RepID=C4J249_MAIZE|nr:unknown [Zea mays]
MFICCGLPRICIAPVGVLQGKHHTGDVREFLLDGRLDTAADGFRPVVPHQAVLAIDGQHIHAPAVVRDRWPQYVQVPVHRLQQHKRIRLPISDSIA